MLSSIDVFTRLTATASPCGPGQAVPELNLDRTASIVSQPEPELIVEDLITPLHRAKLPDQAPADLQLGIDAEAGNERLAGGHQWQPHPAHEIGADVNRRLAGQEHELALVGQLGQAINSGRQHGHGLGVVVCRQVEAGDFEQLRVWPRWEIEPARDGEGHAGAVLLG